MMTFFHNLYSNIQPVIPILSFIFSLLSTICLILTSYIKGVKKILLLLVLTNICIATSYLLNGAVNGAITCFIGAATALVSGIYEIKGRDVPLFVAICYGVAFTVANLFSFEAWYGIIAILASLTFAVSTIQKTGAMYRLWTFGNIFLWICYDIFAHSYSSLTSHLINLGFILSGILIDALRRHQENKKK